MVRPRKTRSRKHKTIERRHASHLLNCDYCFDYMIGLQGCGKDSFRDWQLVKDDFTAAWIEALPGSRPSGWWLHESPDHRECLNHDISDLPKWTKWHFGCSTVMTRQQMKSKGIDEPEYESEYSFLLRHDLLTSEEKKMDADELRKNSSPSWQGQQSEKVAWVLDLLNYDE